MSDYTILTWNINGRSSSSGYIPGFVGRAILEKEADIVILTEFVFCNGTAGDAEKKNAFEFLENIFVKNGYDYYPKEPTKNTENHVNEILIAWKTDCFNLNPAGQIFSAVCSKERNVPNFLTISLIEKKTGTPLRVAGVRITMTTVGSENYPEQARLRYREMEMVYNVLELLSEDCVLIGGDFNNYRRNTIRPEWNIHQLTCGREEYTSYTPDGDSYDGLHGAPPVPEDHFIAKGCTVLEYDYCRDFATGNPVYPKAPSLRYVHPPIPDHAMLIVKLRLPDAAQ